MDELSQTSKEAIDEGIESSLNLVREDLKPTEAVVKKAAQDLIDYTNQLIAKNNQIINQVKGMNDSTSIETVVSFTKKLVKTEEEFKELMKRVFTFQNLANAFLGQQVQMVFVYFNKNNKVEMYSVENSIEELTLSRASSARGGSLSGRYTKSKITKNEKNVLISQENTINNLKEREGETHLESTFAEVYTRFKISKQKQRMRGAAYILWQELGKWDGVWISGAGPLAEAYFNFFINWYIFTPMVEPAVRDFMLNEKYGAVLADSTSGFLQGDIEGQNGMQYGIKTQGASAMGYMDIIDYAKGVIQAADVETYLLNLKRELQEKGSQNMVKTLNYQVEEVAKETLAAVGARIQNN